MAATQKIASAVTKATQALSSGAQIGNQISAAEYQKVGQIGQKAKQAAQTKLANSAQRAAQLVQINGNKALASIANAVSNISALVNNKADTLVREDLRLTSAAQKQLCDLSTALLGDLSSTVKSVVRAINKETGLISSIVRNSTALVVENICEATSTIAQAVHLASIASTKDMIATQQDLYENFATGVVNGAGAVVQDEVSIIAGTNAAALAIGATAQGGNHIVQATVLHNQQ